MVWKNKVLRYHGSILQGRSVLQNSGDKSAEKSDSTSLVSPKKKVRQWLSVLYRLYTHDNSH
jgi:hypothetical protein